VYVSFDYCIHSMKQRGPRWMITGLTSARMVQLQGGHRHLWLPNTAVPSSRPACLWEGTHLFPLQTFSHTASTKQMRSPCISLTGEAVSFPLSPLSLSLSLCLFHGSRNGFCQQCNLRHVGCFAYLIKCLHVYSPAEAWGLLGSPHVCALHPLECIQTYQEQLPPGQKNMTGPSIRDCT
jgi:hypothetical protein